MTTDVLVIQAKATNKTGFLFDDELKTRKLIILLYEDNLPPTSIVEFIYYLRQAGSSV